MAEDMPYTVRVADAPHNAPRLGASCASSERTADVRPTDPCPGKPSQIRPGVALWACRTCPRHSYVMDLQRVLAPAIEHDGERWVCPNRIEVSA